MDVEQIKELAVENQASGGAGFDWNNLITTAGSVASSVLKKPDTYVYNTTTDNTSNKLIIAGIVGILVVIGLKFLKK